MIRWIMARVPKRPMCTILAVVAAGLLSTSGVEAALTYSGDISPDPSAWTSSNFAFVGYNTGNGTLTVDGGSNVASYGAYLGYTAGKTGTITVTGGGTWTGTGFGTYVGYGGTGVLNITNGGTVTSTSNYIGNNAGSTGTVTVDGSTSKWTSSNVYVGYSGTGTLNVLNGSTVSATGATAVGALGHINFGTSGGTLTTGSLSASGSQLSGIGAINTSGIVSDIDLVFDSTHGAGQTLSLNGFTVNLNQSSSGDLGAGHLYSGALTMADGVNVASNNGYLGNLAGSTGTATVCGNGTKWTNSNFLYAGNSGTGTLTITNGATVSNTNTILGNKAGSNGSIVVDGAGSTLSSSGNSFVGSSGVGSLNISNGATVSNNSAVIGYAAGSTGTVTVDGAGSTWTSAGTLGVGSSGTGTLNILNGSAVSVTGTTTVGTLGTINFGTNGGTLTTGGLSASSSQFTGTGTVVTGSWLGDANLLFDSAHGLSTQQVATWNGSGQNIGVYFAPKSTSGGDLAVGYQNSGSLTIKDGLKLSSNNGYVGYLAGSTGTATVSGTGSAWNMSSALNVGYNGTGALSVTNGGSVSASSLYVGKSGTGTLNILNGSAVSVTGTTTVGTLGTINFGTNGGTLTTGGLSASSSQFTGTGTVVTGSWLGDANLLFDSAHGLSTQQVATWNGSGQNIGVYFAPKSTSGGDLAVGYQNSGSLTIKDGLKLSSNNGYVGYLAGSTGTATVSGTGSAWNMSSALNVGYNGTGALSVTNGGSVTMTSSLRTFNIGNGSSGSGTVIVDGAASSVSTLGTFYVGSRGTLHITNGATVTVGDSSNIHDSAGTYINSDGKTGFTYITNGGKLLSSTSGSANTYIGSSSKTGAMIVDGLGSTWRAGWQTYVGLPGAGSTPSGTGRLSISDGGSVTLRAVAVNDTSTLTTDVGKGSSLIVDNGTGTITNSGTIRLVAGAAAANGTYTPLSYGTMSGAGTVQALGGKWNATDHTVIVSDAATTAVGLATTIDLSQTQRVLVTDAATGKSVGAAFQATTTSAPLSLTISAIGKDETASLEGLLASGKSVLSGWTFSSTGYNAGSPVYLSLCAGSATGLTDLMVWEYDGSSSSWSEYTAYDLAYDKVYASFTTTALGTYAVTGTATPTPIPAAVWLLGSGLLGLIGVRRRTSV
jgi:T5SS/PEP-CTERM-associated repeat protein